MSGEIKATREEVVGLAAKEAAENLSRVALWNCAAEQVSGIPSSPEESSRKDSTSEIEMWRRGAHPSQAPPWNQRGKNE